MSSPSLSLEDALAVLGNPEDPRWLQAFSVLARHPETAAAIQATFRETMEEMGLRPSGVDPASGEPVYNADDIARALGIPEGELERGTGGEPRE